MTTRSEGPTLRLREEWPKMLAFAALAGGVTAVVLLAAALRTEGPSAPVGPSRSPAPSTDDDGTAVRPVGPPPPAAPRVSLDELGRRAAGDRARLGRFGSSWTSQLAVLCEPARAQSLVERFATADSLYLLPAFVGDDACFRVCWSHYATREAARRAADLPAGLRAIQPEPLAKRVAEVVR